MGGWFSHPRAAERQV